MECRCCNGKGYVLNRYEIVTQGVFGADKETGTRRELCPVCKGACYITVPKEKDTAH